MSFVFSRGIVPFSTDGIDSASQGEVMGLLEYHAMPILRDVSHGGVLCTFSNRLAPGRGKWCGPSGQAVWTAHHIQITPCWVTLIQPSSQAAVRGRPLAFSLIGADTSRLPRG
jgi:hypothetical protein